MQLTLRPDYAEALQSRHRLQELKRFAEALASYDHAVAVRTSHAEAVYNRGNALSNLKRFEEAPANYNCALMNGQIMPRRARIAASLCMSCNGPSSISALRCRKNLSIHRRNERDRYAPAAQLHRWCGHRDASSYTRI